MPVKPVGPVLVGVVGDQSSEAALSVAFAVAERHGEPIRVLGVGHGDDAAGGLAERVDRWADKYPGVAVTCAARRQIDAAVTLTAASRTAGLLVIENTRAPTVAAVIAALRTRGGCPLVLVGGDRSAGGGLAGRPRRAGDRVTTTSGTKDSGEPFPAAVCLG
ncbi:MAG TPA: hypothetical protein VFH03_17290 [Actinoplanes sp.]|nr:hypothetical protein [Actinoplanes sp.]